MKDSPSMLRRLREPLLILVAFLLLVGLPIAVWLDMHDVTQAGLHRQARDLNAMFTSMRDYYANNIVAPCPGIVRERPRSRMITRRSRGPFRFRRRCRSNSGKWSAISSENINYRFVSDQPFKNRAPHVLDDDRKERYRGFARAAAPADHRAFRRSAFGDRVRSDGPGRSWSRPASAATTPTPTARSATGRSATCAASRRSTIRQPLGRQHLLVQVSPGLFRARGRGRPRLHPACSAARPGRSAASTASLTPPTISSPPSR